MKWISLSVFYVLLSVFTLIIFSSQCISQTRYGEFETLILNLNNYKESLLPKDSLQSNYLTDLIEKWRLKAVYEEELVRCLYKASEGKVIYNFNFQEIVDNQSKRQGKNIILDSITPSDSIALSKNYDLFMLMSQQLVQSTYPYDTNEEKVIQQIKHYKLYKGQTIAEIGAGNGLHTILLGLTELPLKIYSNEINRYQHNYLMTIINPKNKFLATSEIIPILGKENKCKIPQKVDAIIIRNTLHHFSKTKKMLKSIKKTLNPNGKIFILEGYAQESNCSLIKTNPEIKELMKNHGFRLEEEIILGKGYILTYRI